MGWDPWGDIQRAANDTAKAIDNAAGTNFSGRGGGALADLSRNYNNSDLGRWTNGLGTSTYQGISNLLLAAGNAAVGRYQQAGTNLGRATGNIANVVSLNSKQFALDNPELFKSAGKYTFGFTEDLYGSAHGLDSLADRAYVSNADRDSAIRAGAKAGAAVVAAPYLSSAAQWGYGQIAGGSKPLAIAALLSTQGKSGQAAAAKLVTGGLVGDEFQQPVNSIIDSVINPPKTNSGDPLEYQPWKSQVIPGTSVSNGEPIRIGTGTDLTTYVLIGGAALAALMIIRARKSR